MTARRVSKTHCVAVSGSPAYTLDDSVTHEPHTTVEEHAKTRRGPKRVALVKGSRSNALASNLSGQWGDEHAGFTKSAIVTKGDYAYLIGSGRTARFKMRPVNVVITSLYDFPSINYSVEDDASKLSVTENLEAASLTRQCGIA